MHRPQRRVAVRLGLHHDAKSHDIRQLLERHVAPLHLLPDREQRLLAPGDLDHVDATLLAHPGEFLAHLLDHIGALAPQEVQPGLDGFVRFRVQLREGQGLQLRLHRIHADAFGERRVDLHGFACDAPPPLRIGDVVQRPHVVQPVGELDQQHADVTTHCQHQLAEILRLLGAVGL